MRKILLFFLSIFIFTSCSVSKQVLYMQDANLKDSVAVAENEDMRMQPGDKLSIVVSSKDPQLAAVFNLPVLSYQPGSNTIQPQAAPLTEISGYVIDKDGFIDFPVLGKINIEYLTREEICAKIKNMLISANLLKDPVVTVNYMNLRISVLGEVKNPGTYNLVNDQTTIMEGLGMASDMTIYGKRDGVYVIRTENNKRKTYHLDMRSANIFKSPVYYLKQNDIIYVAPNSARAGQSTINDNNVKSVSLWMSMTSVITSICILIFR